MKVVVISI